MECQDKIVLNNFPQNMMTCTFVTIRLPISRVTHRTQNLPALLESIESTARARVLLRSQGTVEKRRTK